MRGQILATLQKVFKEKKKKAVILFLLWHQSFSETLLKGSKRLLVKPPVKSYLCTCISRAHKVHQKVRITFDKQVITYWGGHTAALPCLGQAALGTVFVIQATNIQMLRRKTYRAQN